MKKQEFITFLKKISTVLDKEEIKHELPYCHIDKIDFNYQVIVIPDSIQSFDIGKLFTCTSIKEKEGIIYTVIDNIAINFVKTREDEWFYTFYYYCGNVLHVLVDILAYK